MSAEEWYGVESSSTLMVTVNLVKGSQSLQLFSRVVPQLRN